MNTGIAIREATSEADYSAIGALIAEYVGWCRQRYAADSRLVDIAFSHQSLDSEMAALSASYGPPKGRTLIAWDGNTVIGGVAYRAMSPEVCEMKRMYVQALAAGRGVGRMLCARLLDLASRHGFTRMVLDTTRDMTEAISLYRSSSFTDCAPHIEYPDRIKPMMVFMTKPLAASP